MRKGVVIASRCQLDTSFFGDVLSAEDARVIDPLETHELDMVIVVKVFLQLLINGEDLRFNSGFRHDCCGVVDAYA